MKIPLSRKTGPGVTGGAADRRRGPRFDSRSNRRMPPPLHIASKPDRSSPAAAGPAGQPGAGTPPTRSPAAWPPSSPLGRPSLREKSAFGSLVITIPRRDNTGNRGPRRGHHQARRSRHRVGSGRMGHDPLPDRLDGRVRFREGAGPDREHVLHAGADVERGVERMAAPARVRRRGPDPLHLRRVGEGGLDRSGVADGVSRRWPGLRLRAPGPGRAWRRREDPMTQRDICR